jgi:catechol 2,3-dioxygenase-like lactoylglutathione lyase family enzyme
MADVELLGACLVHIWATPSRLIAHELGFASWSALMRTSDLPSKSPRVRDVAWRCYAQVFVRHVARSTALYRDLLGFEVDYSYGAPPFYAQLRRSEAVFNLRGTGSSPWVISPGEEELLAVRVEVDDVKALFLEVRDKGATIHRRLRTEPWDQVKPSWSVISTATSSRSARPGP